MEQLLQDVLGGSEGAGAYLLVLGVLILCGLGLPVPEDVILITGGYLAYAGKARIVPMVIVCYVGILLGDSIIFALGRRFGTRMARLWPFRLIVTEAKLERVAELFDRYGKAIVIAARFMPGLRAPTYFTAGTTRMSYFLFLLFDGIAALLSAPLFNLLGYALGGQIAMVIAWARRSQIAALAVGAIVVALWIAWKLRRPSTPAQPPSA